MSEQPDHPGYELAYQEGLRAITQQQAVLEGLRSRAATLLAVASLVSSFLGSVAVQGGRPGGWSWVAIGLFVIAVGSVLGVTRQPRLWAMHMQLAKKLQTDFVANEANMVPLFRALTRQPGARR
jgi:hypothetical protein